MNPFQDFLTMLKVGQEEGTNCYDEFDLITVTEMLNLLLHSAETGESDCDLLYATLRMFLAKSDYEQLTLLLKTRLPTSHIEAIFGEDTQVEVGSITAQQIYSQNWSNKMTINIERLTKDRTYWDEVAPEGAIYFDTESELFFNDQGYWPVLGPFKVSYSQNRCSSRFISRPGHEGNTPQAPAAPEWDGYVDADDDSIEWKEGLPPVGCECEINLYGWWVTVTVLAYGKSKFLYEIAEGQISEDGDPLCGEHDGFIMQAKFRPIRTKAERDREELAKAVDRALVSDNTPYHIADAILAEGYKKS